MSANADNATFVFFWRKDSPFSQFHDSVFHVDGQKYTCAEQYMMHQKAGRYSRTMIQHFYPIEFYLKWAYIKNAIMVFF